MAWQIIIVLLALTALGWWLWRRIDARAAELGPGAFDSAPKQAGPMNPPVATPPAAAAESEPSAPEKQA